MEDTNESAVNLYTKYNDHGDEELDENAIPKTLRRWSRKLCRKGRYCTKSKAVLLILTWSLVIATFQIGLDPTALTALSQLLNDGSDNTISTVAVTSIYGPLAFILLFFPLAGFLADVCFGRYKVVICSLKTACITIFVGGLLCGLAGLLLLSEELIVAALVLIGIFGGISGITLLVCYILFSANVIQFGMDQLMESSSEDSTLFIYWYVWTYYLGVSISRIFWNFLPLFCDTGILGFTVTFFIIPAGVVPLLLLVVLPISLCCMCGRRVRRLFMVEPGLQNPYKLVLKVLRFAATHDHPIQRSAFTYCEDELPTRLDLGKNKYGGPFTTEEVENVKVFTRIFTILLSVTPFFATEIAAYVTMPQFNLHLVGTWNQYDNCRDIAQNFLLGNGVLAPILIVILIPLFIFFLRPYVYNYIPGMFKRIGLGMMFYLFSLLCTFATDIVGHTEEENSNATCMFRTEYTYDYLLTQRPPEILNINSAALLIQNICNGLGSLLFYTAAYEFIIAQSPHQMKGLIIGVFYAIKGFSQLMAVVAILVPFYYWDITISPSYPWASCAFTYYLINILIGLFGFLAYTLVAKRYRYRQRDEPSNLHQFVENYYEKTQDEPGYDTDIDLDEYDIHTIS